MSDYDVVLLIEQPFTAQDATNLRRLHEDIEDPVRYHVMLPVEDASSRVETAMGTLGTGEVLTTPPVSVGRVRTSRGCSGSCSTPAATGCRDHDRRDRAGRRTSRRRPGHHRSHPGADRQGRRGRRGRGDHPDPPARRAGLLPPRLDLTRSPQARRPGAAPARARELRRAGRRGRRHLGVLTRAALPTSPSPATRPPTTRPSGTGGPPRAARSPSANFGGPLDASFREAMTRARPGAGCADAGSSRTATAASTSS